MYEIKKDEVMYEQRTLLSALRNGDLSSERSREYWGEQEDRELEQEFRDGAGISELCLKLQRSENAVIQRLGSMGLLTPPSKKHRHKHTKPKCPCPRCLENKCPKYNRKDGKCYV